MLHSCDVPRQLLDCGDEPFGVIGRDHDAVTSKVQQHRPAEDVVALEPKPTSFAGAVIAKKNIELSRDI